VQGNTSSLGLGRHSSPCPNSLLPLVQSVTNNFGSVVRELKQRCGLDYVFCWHAMMGYWSGCMPGVREPTACLT